MLIQAANSNSIQMMQASIDELKEQITRLQEKSTPKKSNEIFLVKMKDSDERETFYDYQLASP